MERTFLRVLGFLFKQMEKQNIYKKLLTIQKKINGLGKDKKSFSYSYVTGDKVLGEIKPLMNELGLILKQEIVSIENTRQDYDVKAGKKSEILSKVMMQFTWIDTETGEKDVNSFGANGQNDWEKGLGSALTYAERYFLLKYFHISTDEDDIDNSDRKPQHVELVTLDAVRFESMIKAINIGEANKVLSALSKYTVTPQQQTAIDLAIKENGGKNV
jgi:hypothetical protein